MSGAARSTGSKARSPAGCEVSVVVPARNAAAHVGRCLGAVFAQDWPGAYEVVVVDDGSTDGTAEVVRQAARGSGCPVRVISQAGAGAGAARNAGVEAAGADVVAFCDADDAWAQGLLSSCMPFLRRRDVQAVIAGYTVEGERGARDEVLPAGALGAVGEPVGDEAFVVAPPAALELYLGGAYVGNADTLLIRKDAYRQLGGFPPEYPVAEDLLLWLKILNRLRFVYVARPLATYHQAGGTRSRTDMVTTWTNVVSILERFAAEERLSPAAARALTRRLAADRMSLALSLWRKRRPWLATALRSCRESFAWRRLRMLLSMCLTRPREPQ